MIRLMIACALLCCVGCSTVSDEMVAKMIKANDQQLAVTEKGMLGFSLVSSRSVRPGNAGDAQKDAAIQAAIRETLTAARALHQGMSRSIRAIGGIQTDAALDQGLSIATKLLSKGER